LGYIKDIPELGFSLKEITTLSEIEIKKLSTQIEVAYQDSGLIG
jgi:hypothetical protein